MKIQFCTLSHITLTVVKYFPVNNANHSVTEQIYIEYLYANYWARITIISKSDGSSCLHKTYKIAGKTNSKCINLIKFR